MEGGDERAIWQKGQSGSGEDMAGWEGRRLLVAGREGFGGAGLTGQGANMNGGSKVIFTFMRRIAGVIFSEEKGIPLKI